MTPIEEQLTEYGMWQRDRDQLVLTAYRSGVSQRRIAALTGLARMTVRSILSSSQCLVSSQVSNDAPGPDTTDSSTAHRTVA